MSRRLKRFATFVAAVMMGTMMPIAAKAGTLLYSYDFDEVGENGLVLAGANKGCGTGVITLKQNGGGDFAPYCTNGAFCSQYAFCSNNRGNSLWLGSSGTSLGCGTAKGFTISFWLKTTASHQAWSDFFGFRIGGWNYRCEYSTSNTSEFMIYMNQDTGSSTIHSETFTQATAGKWKHIAFVFSGADFSTYIDGEFAGTTSLYAGGDLNMVFVGQTLYRNGTTERCYPDNSHPTGTAIDNLDIYSIPLTAAQVKGLAECRRRTIPVFWHFDTTGNRGIEPVNSGTATNSTYKWQASVTTKGNNDYANYVGGALGSAKAFNLRLTNGSQKYWASFRTDGGGADGLGATAGSGFSFSFWMKANANLPNWRSLFGWTLGSRNLRFAWDGNDSANLYSYGGVSTMILPYADRTVDEWQHICTVWNRAESKMDVYCDGKRVSQFVYDNTTPPTGDEAVKMVMFGAFVPGSNSSVNHYNADGEACVDEFAFFNYSLSTNEIAWLGTRLPALPPLEATNIVRTVSADGSWAGGLASWGVKEWNGEVWGDVSRSTIWPAFEDGNVIAEVAFASAATITNDTFVTPKRLTFSNASGGASVAPTLVCAEDGLFAPQSLEVGAGVTLKVSTAFGNRVSAGTLTFGEGAKIVFDADAMLASDPDEHAWKTIMTFDDVVLPEGDTDVLSHFGVSNGKYGLALVDSGKAVSCKRKYGLIIIFR